MPLFHIILSAQIRLLIVYNSGERDYEMGFTQHVEMQMPQLCARCGQAHPTTSYETKSEHQRFFPVRVKYAVHYRLPVCAACDAKLNQRRRTGLIITIVGGLIGLIGVVLLLPYFLSMGAMSTPTINEQAITFSNSYQQYLPASIVTVSGFLIAMAGAAFGHRSLAAWNGKLFRFNNPAFHAAFAQLNPAISRKA